MEFWLYRMGLALVPVVMGLFGISEVLAPY
jgi:TctA family transporter